MKLERIDEVPKPIAQLYEVVKTLKEIFEERPSTPDGHLIGSIGEAIGAYLYDLTLEETCVTAGYDARTKDSNQTVEIKLTAIDKIQIAESSQPDILLVFGLDSGSGFREIFNGYWPAELVARKKPNKRKVISLPEIAVVYDCLMSCVGGDRRRQKGSFFIA